VRDSALTYSAERLSRVLLSAQTCLWCSSCRSRALLLFGQCCSWGSASPVPPDTLSPKQETVSHRAKFGMCALNQIVSRHKQVFQHAIAEGHTTLSRKTHRHLFDTGKLAQRRCTRLFQAKNTQAHALVTATFSLHLHSTSTTNLRHIRTLESLTQVSLSYILLHSWKRIRAVETLETTAMQPLPGSVCVCLFVNGGR